MSKTPSRKLFRKAVSKSWIDDRMHMNTAIDCIHKETLVLSNDIYYRVILIPSFQVLEALPP